MNTTLTNRFNQVARKSKVLQSIKSINTPVHYKWVDIKELTMKNSLAYLISGNLKRKIPTMNMISSYWDYQLKFNNSWLTRFNYFKKDKQGWKTHLFDFNVALYENGKAKISFNQEEPPTFFEETWINNHMFEKFINNKI